MPVEQEVAREPDAHGRGGPPVVHDEGHQQDDPQRGQRGEPAGAGRRIAPMRLEPGPAQHEADQHQAEPRPRREIVEEHEPDERVPGHEARQGGRRERERDVPDHGQRQQRHRRRPEAQQPQRGGHDDDREADGLQDTAGQDRLVPKNQQVEQ